MNAIDTQAGIESIVLDETLQRREYRKEVQGRDHGKDLYLKGGKTKKEEARYSSMGKMEGVPFFGSQNER